jgi:hypothetical protein
MPMPDSETAPHQDITFVDESRFVSVNVWIALQDTDETNGCMYFLRGSHNFLHTIRPTHEYKWTYQNVIDEIKSASVSFPVKAGEAFIFNHAVIHGSHPNTSGAVRLAAVMAAYNSSADLIHYYLPDIDSDVLQKYGMNKEAYLSFEKKSPPRKGILKGELRHKFHQVDVEEFNGLLGHSVVKEKSKGPLLFFKNIFS